MWPEMWHFIVVTVLSSIIYRSIRRPKWYYSRLGTCRHVSNLGSIPSSHMVPKVHQEWILRVEPVVSAEFCWLYSHQNDNNNLKVFGWVSKSISTGEFSFFQLGPRNPQVPPPSPLSRPPLHLLTTWLCLTTHHEPHCTQTEYLHSPGKDGWKRKRGAIILISDCEGCELQRFILSTAGAPQRQWERSSLRSTSESGNMEGSTSVNQFYEISKNVWCTQRNDGIGN